MISALAWCVETPSYGLPANTWFCSASRASEGAVWPLEGGGASGRNSARRAD